MKAIIGNKGVGKTTVLMALKQKGYKIFNCDDWIHEQYNTNEVLKVSLSNILGDQIIVNGMIERTKIKEMIIKDVSIIQKIMELTHPPLFEKLKNSEFDFVEIPALEYSPVDFSILFEEVFRIVRPVNIEEFYKKLMNPVRKVLATEVENNEISEAVKIILD